MALTIRQVRAAAQRTQARVQKSEEVILAEARDTAQQRFDIFLSHSSMDKDLVIGVKQLIEDAGHSVYVDWIDDADLDRAAIDRERADHLRSRMQQCDTLFYAHTPNAAMSRWCPWELGFFDALKRPDQQVFVLPVLGEGQTYSGQEYLSLYETVDLSSYKHQPRRKREEDAMRGRLLRDAFGLRNPHNPRGIF